MAFGGILLVGYSGKSRAGSQSQRAIWFILPARGASHIIMYFIVSVNSPPRLVGLHAGCINLNIC